MRHSPRLRVQVLTAATALPVSLPETKARVGIPDTDESQDASLMGMIRATTVACERYTRRSFINTTWTMFMDRFPGKELPWWDGVRQIANTELTDLTESIIVPKPPLVSVTFVKAHHQDGTTTTVTATDYIVDVHGEPGRIALKVSKTWPTNALRAINGVEVEFVAGFGPVGSDVPAPIRDAIFISVAELHTNREGAPARFEKVGESSISRFSPENIPLPAQHLLATYKDWRL